MCTKSYWGLFSSKYPLQSVKGTFWSSTFPQGEVCINREAFNSLITLSSIKKSSYVSWKVDLNVFKNGFSAQQELCVEYGFSSTTWICL